MQCSERDYWPFFAVPLIVTLPVTHTVPGQPPGEAGLIVSAKTVGATSCVSPLELVAVTLIVAAPELLGVPLSTHALDRLKPAGTPVAVQVMGTSPAEKESVWL